MSQIKASEVKALRDKTDAPMMECKKALIASSGDIDAAIEELRKSEERITIKKARDLVKEAFEAKSEPIAIKA